MRSRVGKRGRSSPFQESSFNKILKHNGRVNGTQMGAGDTKS